MASAEKKKVSAAFGGRHQVAKAVAKPAPWVYNGLALLPVPYLPPGGFASAPPPRFFIGCSIFDGSFEHRRFLDRTCFVTPDLRVKSARRVISISARLTLNVYVDRELAGGISLLACPRFRAGKAVSKSESVGFD